MAQQTEAEWKARLARNGTSCEDVIAEAMREPCQTPVKKTGVDLPPCLYQTTGDIKDFGKFTAEQMLAMYQSGKIALFEKLTTELQNEKVSPSKTPYQEAYNRDIDSTLFRIKAHL
jgi:hypothetical protein